MPQPTVAILIVTYNNEKDIPHLMESLRHTDYSPEHVHVYIADNNSHDSTISLVHTFTHAFPFEYILIEHKENFGFDVANNELYQRAKNEKNSDYVVLLNPDTAVDPQWLKKLIVCMEQHKEVGAAQSLLLLKSDPEKINSAGNALFYGGIGYVSRMGEKGDTVYYQNIAEIGYASGAAVCYRASVLSETGLFYPDFFYLEDADLSWRMRLLGYSIIMCPQSVVWHNYSYSKGVYKMKAIELNRHKALLQNYKIPTLIVLLPMLLLFEIMIIALSCVQCWGKEKLKNYKELWSVRGCVIERRKHIRHTRKIKDRTVIRQMALAIHFPEGDPLVLTYMVNPLFIVYGWIIRACIWW